MAVGGVPEDLDVWLGQRADELGVPREDLLAGIVGSYRQVVESDADDVAARLGDGEPPPDVDDRIAATVEERTTRFEERVGERIQTLEAELDEQLDEIRKRVVEVKNGVDAAAAADHDHAAFERIDDLADRVDRLESAVSSLRESGGAGADAETIETLDEKLTKVANAVVALREADGIDGTREIRREALAELKRQAGQLGVESAECDACGGEVNLALLTEPACPHCETELREVTDSTGWLFGSASVGNGGDGTVEGAK
jgi:predicted Zn-ribbon and HTH transcriptional regulator